MSANFHKNKIGTGVFTTSDVAAILGKSTHRVSRYIKEYGDSRIGRKLFNEDYSWFVDGSRLVNFYALIEIAVFLLLRDEFQLQISTITKAHESMASMLNTPYPFASAKVFTDSKKICYESIGDLINADSSHQINIKEIVRPLLDKIDFDGFDLAMRYYPLGKSHEVVVDPRHQFGQPTIRNTNIRVETIKDMMDGGETIESMKLLYGLNKKQIADSLLYYKKAA